MRETTTHCDFCDNPLGLKCDRTAESAMRARLHGLWAISVVTLTGSSYRFFCSKECEEGYDGKTKIYKTCSEEKEKPVN